MSLVSEIEKFTRKFLYFTPYYNRRSPINPEEPEIYNSHGQKLHVFFMSDREISHNPYAARQPEYIFWDRYNFALKTHFYSHYEAFNLVGSPDKRFAFLNESRAIKPKCYKKYLREKKYFENEFDLLFTFDIDILETINNARLVPFCANYWYGEIDRNIKLSRDNYLRKDKNISILSSHKKSCELHLLRKALAFKCRDQKLADAYGTFDTGEKGSLIPPERTLEKYRYSIIIENDITPYFFTEKITNCFAAETIPIYLGATKIHEFFNPDGIINISVKDAQNIEHVLKQCTPAEYERRLPAILDNFERVKKFRSMYDYMFAKYLRNLYE